MNWKDKLLNPHRFRESMLTDDKRGELSAQTDFRNALESDFGRVVFSPACRRLHDKTQVFPLTTNDNIHSRLTHSLEVMNMGLSFSINLSKNNKFIEYTGLDVETILRGIGAILKTTCLVHDIGNPPFGHFGEEVIQDYFKQLFDDIRKGDCVVKKGIEQNDYLNKRERKQDGHERITEERKDFQRQELENFIAGNDRMLDYTQFDGNAEGLRILTKLQYLGDLSGLNLTFASLAASVKYPNLKQGEKSSENVGRHKHGVMTTEREVMETLSKECELPQIADGLYRRHPLTFLMEAADTICYLVMDMDDARQRKWIDTDDVWEIVNSCDSSIRNGIVENYELILGSNKNKSKMWMCLRTAMLSYLTKVAQEKFVDHLEDIESGKFAEELLEQDELVGKIQKFSVKNILSQRDINSLETTGKAIISGLLEHYIALLFHPEVNFRNRAKALMSRSILHTVIAEHMQDHKEQFEEKYGNVNSAEDIFEDFDLGDLTAEERFRAVRDYVAGMTDKFALNHYKELSGQRLS